MDTNLAYQEPPRIELLNGRAAAMSPAATRHNQVMLNIAYLFKHYLRGKKCVPFADGETVVLSDKDHFIPDFMVVCDRSKIKRNGVYGAPDLAVEILSPSTARNDKQYKKNVYEACGVSEYWIVDPAGKSVEIYLLSDGRYSLDNVCFYHSAEELAEMTEDEKDGLPTEFRCHLFDGLVIRLEDIFGDLF